MKGTLRRIKSGEGMRCPVHKTLPLCQGAFRVGRRTSVAFNILQCTGMRPEFLVYSGMHINI